MLEVCCPRCSTLMELIAKTIPFGLELIYQCFDCHQKFLLDPDGWIYRLIDYPVTDLERAAYNRKIIANGWFNEAWLAIEQWLEENPYTEWREPGGRYEKSGRSCHEQALGKSGVNCPERRKQ